MRTVPRGSPFLSRGPRQARPGLPTSIRVMLDDEEDCRLLHGAAEQLARAEARHCWHPGRTLRKPSGRVRALVVGNVLRRFVGCVRAQQFAPQLQDACLHFQFGLSTSPCTEAVTRLLRAAKGAAPRTTALSVDAVGAFDHVARFYGSGLKPRVKLKPFWLG